MAPQAVGSQPPHIGDMFGAAVNRITRALQPLSQGSWGACLGRVQQSRRKVRTWRLATRNQYIILLTARKPPHQVRFTNAEAPPTYKHLSWPEFSQSQDPPPPQNPNTLRLTVSYMVCLVPNHIQSTERPFKSSQGYPAPTEQWHRCASRGTTGTRRGQGYRPREPSPQ